MGRFIRWVENGSFSYRIFNDAVRDFEPRLSKEVTMLLELTREQDERIPHIKEDWSHIARAGRQVDWDLVLPLAQSLFPDLAIVKSEGVPVFLASDYERVMSKECVNRLWNEVLWSVMSDVLCRDLKPAEYELYFRNVSGGVFDNKYLCQFAVFDFANRVLGLPGMTAYGPLLLLIRSVGGFHFEGATRLVLYDYPACIHTSLDFGTTPVLHNTDGPAIGYRDGSGYYYIEGFSFEARVVTNRDRITVAEVEKEHNAERRRILTEQMGISRYLHETKAKVIDMDSVRVMTVGSDDRRMPRALIEAKDGRRFLCGTDGSTKRVYYMPVPRDATTCKMAHEAIAGPVGTRTAAVVSSPMRFGAPALSLGLDEKDCIAQS